MWFELTTVVVIGTDNTGSCKSNYHTITTMTAPDLTLTYWYYNTTVQIKSKYIYIYTCIYISKTSKLNIYININYDDIVR
jgi:hypothetical protein